MDQQALQNLKQTLAEADNLGIVVGQNPTIDEMGAALALYLSLKTANKKVSIASPTEPIVELSSLVGIDQVRSSLGGSAAGDLVVSFPYKEGEIEKVSYTLENGYLNIVVKAGELGLNFADEDVKFTHGSSGVPTHLVLVGVPSLSDVDSVINPEEMKDATIINIDTKPENQNYGQVVLVSPQLSSVSELMTQVLLSSGMPMDVDIAQNLLSGIAFSTSNFQDPKTSFMAFEMAGELMRLGAVRPSGPISPAASMPQPQRFNRPMPQPSQPADAYDYPAMPQPRPQPQPRMNPTLNRMPGGVPMPRPGQQPRPGLPPMPNRGTQPQQRPQPRMNNGLNSPMQSMPQNRPQPNYGMSRPQQPQQPRSRQDEIREELARAAAAQSHGQQSYQQPSNDNNNHGQQNAHNDHGNSSNGHSQNPPADWLTPKVYKGSTDIDN